MRSYEQTKDHDTHNLTNHQNNQLKVEEQCNPYHSLQTARPILPPGLYQDLPDKISLAYKYSVHRQKLNKTTFPEIKNKHWMEMLETHHQKGIKELPNDETGETGETAIEQVNHEYAELISGLRLIYSRINIDKYNRVRTSDKAIMCSFFLDPKKEGVKSRKQPIYEYARRFLKDIVPYHCQNDPIRFSSNFQSGNLCKAFRNPKENVLTYQLYMQNDTNTKGCTQWFHFSALTQKRLKARFRIMNFYKLASLYTHGMKILVSDNSNEWKRVGTAIRYYKVTMSNGKIGYALEFLYEIEKPETEYRFCYGYPYTYSQVENSITALANKPENRKILLKSVLCQSHLGNNVYLLNISQHVSVRKQEKPVIYIIARQHPGETPASFVTEGLIHTLLSNCYEMNELRHRFIIRVIPMVNIDGTINGNYRSNFSGNDLNRQWRSPSRKLHPQVFYLKQQMINNKKSIALFLDIHAHSRKQIYSDDRMNSFFYGSKINSLENRMYPFVCSKLNKFIDYTSCSFTDDPSKKTTARVVLETQLSIKKSLTFEVSFYGYELEKNKGKCHFKREDFRGIGESLALGLFYSEIQGSKFQDSLLNKSDNIRDPASKSNRQQLSCQLNTDKISKEQRVRRISRKIFTKWKQELEKYQNQDSTQTYSQGSSLNPEQFELNEEEIQETACLQQNLNEPSNRRKHPFGSSAVGSFKVLSKQKPSDNMLVLNNVNNDSDSQKQTTSKVGKNVKQLEQNDEADLSTYKLPFTIGSSIVHQKLNLDPQIHDLKTHRRYQSISDRKAQEIQEPSHVLKDQFIVGRRIIGKSIQLPKHNYKYQTLQLRKALRYFIKNKNDYEASDYSDYQQKLWHSTNKRFMIFRGQK